MKSHIKKSISLFIFLFVLLSLNPIKYVFAEESDKECPTISVIIPVYNVGRDLDKSLQTIENQTFKDIEIICVNDGSKDNSLTVLEEHAQIDNRIKIIDQENQGASEARNVGLRAAKGEYIYFCDGDDYVLPYTLEKALDKFGIYENLDAVEFGVHRVNYAKEVNIDDYKYEDSQYDLLECAEGDNPYEIFKTFGWGMWKYLYKKSFLINNNLEFKKGLRTNEDVLFGFLSMGCMRRVCRDKNIGYIYRVRRPDSTTNTICKIKKKQLEGFIEIANEIINHRQIFNFKCSDEYILDFIMGTLFKRVKNLDDVSDRTYYANIICKDIGENFVNKYKVGLSESNEKRFKKLEYWAKGSKKRKVKKLIRSSKKHAVKRKNKKL